MGMTREEKEQTGEYVLKMARLLEDGCWQQKMLLNAVHIIDEVLEQEPVLDKIRAEIDNSLSDGIIHKKTVLGIIDKYNAECEEKK